MDSLWNFLALKGKNLYITGVPHNYKKGFNGAILKAGGLVPIFNDKSNFEEFENTITKLLNKPAFVHFYPEETLWPYYEQSRPFKRGAFLFAVKNNVPIVPIIFLFEPRKSFKSKFKVTAQICEPIYPDTSISEREASLKLQKQAQEVYNKCIIEHYGYDEKTFQMNKINKRIN